VIRAFCRDLGAHWTVEVWPRWWNAAGRWLIDWELRADGRPSKTEVAAALAAHRGASRYAGQVELSTAAGEAINWARACMRPGAAAIVDTETTGLDAGDVVIEIAAIDACTGQVLLDTLVNPGGVPVHPDARRVHGIGDAALAAAPAWAQVLPAFLTAVQERRIIAYNASFGTARIADTHQHAGLARALLPPLAQWDCLMEARSAWARIGHWLPLGGGHRALDDCLHAWQVMRAMAAPLR
jgi:hypothetical protein